MRDRDHSLILLGDRFPLAPKTGIDLREILCLGLFIILKSTQFSSDGQYCNVFDGLGVHLTLDLGVNYCRCEMFNIENAND